MIHRYLKIYICLIMLLSDFLVFADDDPGTGFEDENGDVDGTVEEPVAVNPRLIFLAIAGVAFAFYHFVEKKKASHGGSHYGT
ncbi:hypothetical protein [Flavobacterium sp.]|uniref:hypothetical protein n=2 Tax=Flavobacterium sp. TaxID=239 RepID=UPI004033428E